MLKRFIHIFFIVAIMPALLGVHVVHHVCHIGLDNHHVDVEIVTGLAQTTLCNSSSDHCCDSSSCGESEDCDDCESEYLILESVNQSMTTESHFLWDAPELTLFANVLVAVEIVEQTPVFPPFIDAAHCYTSVWQSFSGVFLC